MADNQANLKISLSMSDDAQSVYNQVRQLIDDLASRAANVQVNLTQGGGAGGFGGGVTAAPGAAGGKARVAGTVMPSMASASMPMYDAGAGRYRDAASGRFTSNATAQSMAAAAASGIMAGITVPPTGLNMGGAVGGDNGMAMLARSAMASGNPSMAAAAMTGAGTAGGGQPLPNIPLMPGQLQSILSVASGGSGGGYTPPPGVMAAESAWWNGDRGLGSGAMGGGYGMYGGRGRMGFGAMWGLHMLGNAAAQSIDLGLNQQTHDIVSGRPDILNDARARGGLMGGLIGGGAGLLLSGGNPWIAGIGASIGNQLGGSAMQRFASGDDLQAQTTVQMLPAGAVAASIYGDPGKMVKARDDWGSHDSSNWFNMWLPGSVFHADRMRSWVNTRKSVYNSIHAPDNMPARVWEQFKPTEAEISGVYGGMERSLLMGGINPEAPSGRMNPAPSAPSMPPDVKEIMDWFKGGKPPSWAQATNIYDAMKGNLIFGTAAKAVSGDITDKDADKLMATITGMKDASPQAVGALGDLKDYAVARREFRHDMDAYINAPSETTSQMYSRRLLDRYLRAAPEMQREVGPVFESLPETGGNLADIIEKYGPQAAYDFASLGFEGDKMPPYKVTDLYANYARVRGARRAAERGSLQIRGAGEATLSAVSDEADAIGALPGGSDSTAMLKARQKMRGAAAQAYHEADVTGYELPLTSLRGQRERLDVSPFEPGSIFGNAVRTIHANQGYLGSLRQQEGSLRQRGLLSEDDELKYRQREEGLMTDISKEKATLQYGILDRLPGMAAGLPAGVGRFNSDSLTALNLGRAGFGFVASAGALSGAHARMQRDFASGAGDSYQPSSRTQAMNNSQPQFEEATNELKRIRQILERNSGGGGGMSARPRNDMAPQAGAPSQGAQTPFN